MLSDLNRIKDELIQNMNKSLDLIKRINKIGSMLSSDEIYSIYELSFLKIYLSWESFIGRVFILYMIGEKTDNGYAPKCYITPKDEKHAYDIIKSGQQYTKWIDIKYIREKSELFFENGEPFKSALYSKTNIKGALQNMKILRNIIVHASKEAKEKYKNMLRNELGTAPTISPGEFLSMMRSEKPKISYIVYYKKILEVASNGIVR
ncbi:MAG: hypothetical protein J7K33_06405 [Candidatus Marinimicrobia bacterium]|nr:hypothetical protein [Candidatus Neomarinimicrobiota bacterium]